MKAMVTGGTGFLGPYILYQLVDYYDEIILIDPFKDSIEFNDEYFKFIDYSNYELKPEEKQRKMQKFRDNIKVIKADIRDPGSLAKSMQEVSHVFHAAAIVATKPKDPKEIHIPVNIEGTKNILKLCAEHKIQRLIYTSSFVALGPLTKEQAKTGILADESQNVKTQFKHSYVDTKYEAGQIVDKYSQTANYDIITVCPTTILGYGMDNMVTQAFLDYIHQKLPGLPNGGMTRINQVLAEDVGRGHLLAALKGKHGEKYILGGNNLFFRDFFQMFGELLGYPMPRSVPSWLIGIVLNVQEKLYKNPQMTASEFKMAGLEWTYSIEKAKKELGYHPHPINKKTFVKPFIRYLLENDRIQTKYAIKLKEILNSDLPEKEINQNSEITNDTSDFSFSQEIIAS